MSMRLHGPMTLALLPCCEQHAVWSCLDGEDTLSCPEHPPLRVPCPGHEPVPDGPRNRFGALLSRAAEKPRAITACVVDPETGALLP